MMHLLFDDVEMFRDVQSGIKKKGERTAVKPPGGSDGGKQELTGGISLISLVGNL